MTISSLIFAYFILINLITFIIFGVDKHRARQHRFRISEATLFSLAILGGSIGAEFGMYIWHHKTKHLHFVIGIPLIFLLQLLLIFYLTHL